MLTSVRRPSAVTLAVLAVLGWCRRHGIAQLPAPSTARWPPRCHRARAVAVTHGAAPAHHHAQAEAEADLPARVMVTAETGTVANVLMVNDAGAIPGVPTPDAKTGSRRRRSATAAPTR